MPDFHPAYITQWSDELGSRIKQAMADQQLAAYRISTGKDESLHRCLIAAIDDQLIDSHLEAVRFEASTDRRGHGFDCPAFSFDPDSLVVLLRRLSQPLPKHWETYPNGEYDYSLGAEMQGLANDIFGTLEMPAELDS
jgi:hypothetical protein